MCDCCYCYSVTKLCPTLCNSMDCSTPGFPVLNRLPDFAQTHVHWVSDAIQLSHPLPPSSPPVLNLSQHQGLFQWVSSYHQVAKVLEQVSPDSKKRLEQGHCGFQLLRSKCNSWSYYDHVHFLSVQAAFCLSWLNGFLLVATMGPKQDTDYHSY